MNLNQETHGANAPKIQSSEPQPEKVRFGYACVRGMAEAALRSYFRWQAWHPERVPLTGGVIIAANHSSYVDPASIGTAIWRREVYYLGKKELLQVRMLGPILRYLNVIGTIRDGKSATGLRAIHGRVLDHRVVLVFPEGRRIEPATQHAQYDSKHVKNGVGWLVLNSPRAVVIPAKVFGSAAAWGRKMSFPRPRSISVKFGPPLNFNDCRQEFASAIDERQKALFVEVTRRVMEAVLSLEPGLDAKRPKAPRLDVADKQPREQYESE